MEDIYEDFIEECLETEPAFKELLMNKVKNKSVDTLTELDLTKFVQARMEDMIEVLLSEDSELYDNIKDELTDLICDKLEVNFK